MKDIDKICSSVRFTQAERRTAEEGIRNIIAGWGYPVRIEGDGRNHRQIVVGDPEQAGILVTAHYDTPSRKPLPGLEMPLSPVLHGLYQLLCSVIYMIPALAAMMLVMQFAANARAGLMAFLLCYLLTLVLLRTGTGNRNNANASSGLKAVLCLLESLPEDRRAHLCAVLFDDGEKGHKSVREFGMRYPREQYMRFSVCLDRVGRGTCLRLIASDQARKSTGFGSLKRLVEENRELQGRVVDSRRCFMSREARFFRCGCQLTLLEKSPVGLVHTSLNTARDTQCDDGCISRIAGIIRLLMDTYN